MLGHALPPAKKNLQKQTRLYFEKWMKYLKEHDHVVGYDDNNVFSGVTLDQIPQFEKCYNINVDIFELTEKETSEKLDEYDVAAQHHPISVSICSNVEDFATPCCIVDSHIDTLVQKMVEYMVKVANRGEELVKKKFDYVLKDLEDMIMDSPTELCRKSYNDRRDILTEGDESWEEDDAYRTRPSDPTADELIKKLGQLKEKFESYCKQMMCLGFNSSKYDMNLVKSHRAKHLHMEKDNVFTVKQNNQYACLANSTLKFLDITSNLLPGINYANFFLKPTMLKRTKDIFLTIGLMI